MPEDRQSVGVVGDLPVWENLCAEVLATPVLSRWGWVRRGAARAYAQAALKAAKEPAEKEKTSAQIEAAEARAELAQLALDRCSLKAPFAGMVLTYPVSVGQFVTKGTTVAELADVIADAGARPAYTIAGGRSQ